MQNHTTLVKTLGTALCRQRSLDTDGGERRVPLESVRVSRFLYTIYYRCSLKISSLRIIHYWLLPNCYCGSPSSSLTRRHNANSIMAKTRLFDVLGTVVVRTLCKVGTRAVVSGRTLQHTRSTRLACEIVSEANDHVYKSLGTNIVRIGHLSFTF